jgi:radical SAM protein with 4Fe4S-binding SPASM domain
MEHSATIDVSADYRTTTPLDQLGPPEFIEIEPIHSCNLRCVMCHVSYEVLSKTRLDPSFVERLDGLAGKWAVVGGEYEPMVHPDIVPILRGLSDRGLKIDLTTNGTMFSPEIVAALADADFRRVTISFDGISKAAYEGVRRRADHKAALDGILRFKKAVQAHNPSCRFIVNYTVLRANIAEMAEAVDFWESQGFDHIGFIGMVQRDENALLAAESIQGEMEAFRDQIDRIAANMARTQMRISTSNSFGIGPRETAAGLRVLGGVLLAERGDAWWPENPRPLFQARRFPGMPVPCSSPFKALRLSYDGSLTLCTQFRIGNIYEADSLLDLWYGAKAKRVREALPQRPAVCRACDYFRLCVNAGNIDPADESSFVLDPMPYTRPLGTLCGMSLVVHGTRIYAFPKDDEMIAIALQDPDPTRLVLDEADPASAFRRLCDWIGTHAGSPQVREGDDIALWMHDRRWFGVAFVAGQRLLERALRIRHADSESALRRQLADDRSIDPSDGLPVHVLTFGQYNVVRFRQTYFGLPQFLGKVDLDRARPDQSRYFLQERRLDRLIAAMRKAPNPRPELRFAGRLVRRFGGRWLRSRLGLDD